MCIALFCCMFAYFRFLRSLCCKKGSSFRHSALASCPCPCHPYPSWEDCSRPYRLSKAVDKDTYLTSTSNPWQPHWNPYNHIGNLRILNQPTLETLETSGNHQSSRRAKGFSDPASHATHGVAVHLHATFALALALALAHTTGRISLASLRWLRLHRHRPQIAFPKKQKMFFQYS